MNGAVMDYRQEKSLHPQHKDSQHSSGYHLQQPNSHPQYSKAVNYQSDPYLVHGSPEHLQNRNLLCNEYRSRLSSSGDRPSLKQAREPMELPVPQFEIDENYVGVPPITMANSVNNVKDSKDLDLDTRINLLIKSKALLGMHPIFSDLSESEDSSIGSNDSLTGLSNSKREPLGCDQMSTPEKLICHTSFDNPETPLSRPPSPFISRATYLFWFNKAIEIKQAAKAQEKALLEEATKKLSQNNSYTTQTNKAETSKPESNILKILLDAVGKELTEVIKQEFIKEIIENTAFNSLEDWWEKQRPVVSSTTDENGKEIVKVKNDLSLIVDSNTNEREFQDQKPTSPKVRFSFESIDSKSDYELRNMRNPSPDELKPNSTVFTPKKGTVEVETEQNELTSSVSSIQNEVNLIFHEKSESNRSENLNSMGILSDINVIEKGKFTALKENNDDMFCCTPDGSENGDSNRKTQTSLVERSDLTKEALSATNPGKAESVGVTDVVDSSCETTSGSSRECRNKLSFLEKEVLSLPKTDVKDIIVLQSSP